MKSVEMNLSKGGGERVHIKRDERDRAVLTKVEIVTCPDTTERYGVQWNNKCLWKFYIAIKACVGFCALNTVKTFTRRLKNQVYNVAKEITNQTGF